MDILKKYLYWATIGLFAYMPFHIFIAQWLSTYTGGLDAWKIAKDVVAAILVSVLVCTVLLARKYTRNYLLLVGFAVIYLFLHLAVALGTSQPTDTALLATVYNNRLVWYLLIGYSLAILVPKLARPRRFLEVLLVVSTIVSLFAIVQRFLPPDFLTNFGYSIERGTKPNFFIDDKPDLPRVFSTIRDPNSLGAFLILPSTILIMALVRRWYTPQRSLLAGLLLLHGLAATLTFSRSTWLAFIIAHAAGLGFVFRHSLKQYLRKSVWPAAIVLVVLAGLVFVLRDQYFVQNIVFHADESTTLADPNELRASFAQQGLNGIGDNPEGNGPGTAGLVSTRLPGGGLLTENYYLQIGYEVGVAGLALFVGFLAFIVRLLWTRRDDWIAQGLLASFAGLAFINLFFHAWSNEAVAIGWFMLAGVVLGVQHKKPKRLLRKN